MTRVAHSSAADWRDALPSIAEGPSIFLAGPTPRDGRQSWRVNARDYFADELKFDGTLLLPEPSIGSSWPSDQIRVEKAWLLHATIIMFWIPRSLELPGFTTNIEWGWCMGVRQERVVLGCPEEAEKMGYIRYDADTHSIPTYDNLADTCAGAVELCRVWQDFREETIL